MQNISAAQSYINYNYEMAQVVVYISVITDKTKSIFSY